MNISVQYDCKSDALTYRIDNYFALFDETIKILILCTDTSSTTTTANNKRKFTCIWYKGKSKIWFSIYKVDI